MKNCKRLGRLIVYSLLLCALVTLLPRPVSAVAPVQASAHQRVEATGTGHTVSFVRYSANRDSLIIGCLENDTKLTVLNATQEYYYIDCYDLKGYIAKSQVMQKADGGYYVNCVAGSSETSSLPSYSTQDGLSLRGSIREVAMQYIGVPYVMGGTTPYGFDCSGFTQYVFRKLGIELDRTVAAQLKSGIVIDKEDLQCGDLIFFQNTTGWGRFASHIGIYIGNGQLIHAGSRGIAVVPLDAAYYTYHFMCARRVILSDIATEPATPTLGIHQNFISSYWRESSQTPPSGNFFV